MQTGTASTPSRDLGREWYERFLLEVAAEESDPEALLDAFREFAETSPPDSCARAGYTYVLERCASQGLELSAVGEE